MSKATDVLRKHVASYRHLSAHRQNCLDVCDEIDRLVTALENVLEAVESNSKNGAEAVARNALRGCDQ